MSPQGKTPKIDYICLGTTVTESKIFSCLSPKDLIKFSLTCRKAYEAVLAYNRIAYKIDTFLSRYLAEDQIEPFRLLQDKTGALISGSAALQFFDRTFYEESDLDLFVGAPNAKELAYFVRNCGYSYAPREGQTSSLDEAIAMATSEEPPDQDDYEYIGGRITGVWSFLRDGKKIQVISARYSPLAAVLKFHSTCVMQIISAHHAVSLYPFATFLQRRSLVVATRPNKERAIQKYMDRGWRMVQKPPYSEVANTSQLSDFRGCMRHVGDRFCWTIPLPPLSSEDNTSLTLTPTLFANSWTLELWSECYMKFGFIWEPSLFKPLYTVAPRLADLAEAAYRKVQENTELTRRDEELAKALLQLYQGRVPDLMKYKISVI